MPWVVDKYFESCQPLYYFNSTEQKQCQAVIFDQEWAKYIEKNYSVVRNWTFWEWLTYMESKNPNTSNLINKLFIIQEDDSRQLLI